MEQQPMQAQTNDPANSQEMARIAALYNLTRQMKSGANNFYWIAGLSVVNSLMSIFGGGIFFVIGLGATLFVDAVAGGVAENFEGSPIVLGIGFIISLFISLIFAAFGYLANKKFGWAFIVGMLLYGLDAVVMLIFQEWIGFAFHLYFMWGAWTGFSAFRKLKAIEAASVQYTAVPPAETAS